MEYEIEHNLVLSTAHITKKDDEQLALEAETNLAPDLCVYHYEYGYMIFVPLNIEGERCQEEIKKSYSSARLFAALLSVANLSKSAF